MPSTIDAADRFSSFAELQRMHLDLTRRSREGADDPQFRSQIDLFVDRVKNTGTVLDGAERQAAQNILDYWSAEVISLSDIGENWSLPKLLPFAQKPEPSALAPDVIEARMKARKGLQLAATARLWKDSKGEAGYLLKGAALNEAGEYSDDPDVAELVRASSAYVRARRRVSWLAGAVFVLLAVCVVLLFAVFAVSARDAALLAKQDSAIPYKMVTQYKKLLAQQQEQINQLNAALRKANVYAPSQLTEIAPVADAGPSPTQTKALRGYIWVGSDNDPNLIDANTLAPVKPGAVIVGSRYKVTKNLVLRSGLPSKPDYIPTASAGVVPEQTTVKILSAPTPFARPTGVQYWVDVEVIDPNQPIVYIEYAGGSPTLATVLSNQLKTGNFRVAGIESSDLAKGVNEIRFYFPSDKAGADQLRSVIAAAIAHDPALKGLQPPKVVDLTAMTGARNFPGVIELWIDLPAPRS
jgi:hypothetical protein